MGVSQVQANTKVFGASTQFDAITALNNTLETNLDDFTLCSVLSTIFKESVILGNSSTYEAFNAGYWSQQQEDVDSYCIFQPAKATEVAISVLLSRVTQCSFAVKSGGHAAFTGASNIQGGITIDMSKLSSISLSEDQRIACVGTGNTWYDVYTYLEPMNLSVVGGRVADIGVGGLTTGVTADGTIINANPGSYPDLYWALRGGGNNFGIVTRFDLFTFPQGLMWGGARLISMSYNETITSAFTDFGTNAPSDPNAALIVAFGYSSSLDQYLASIDLEYAKPITSPPPIFENFTTIPFISNTIAPNRSLSQLTLELNAFNPIGQRETFWTATFKLNSTLTKYILTTFTTFTTPLKNIPGLVPACVFQVITTPTLSQMSKNGGNALGLSSAEPLLLLNLAFRWSYPSDDPAILAATANIVSKSIAQARAWGLDVEFLYMNYASQFQDVLPTYNATNYATLKGVAAKYDPDRVFQVLQPGYFKLSGGAPDKNWPSR
ncbi:MAG: hypothetical protein M1834_004899 [Cirrosporium novae-zelandiae]|nr:MAG: hypothetical protein M1834_004899 [Cirrosporium novae-zelandiae]